MAYMNQDRKANLASGIKEILKRYGVKGTLSTDRYSLTLNIKSSTLDFIGNMNETTKNTPYYRELRLDADVRDYVQINTYHYRSQFSNKVIIKFFDEITRAMNIGNHDNSDIQTDYFDVGWYVNINVGKWNKPYILEK
jgi:hypothetical protein